MGGTEIEKAVKFVYSSKRIEGHPLNIFLLTDGDVNYPENILKIIYLNAKPNVRFYSIGIGDGCS